MDHFVKALRAHYKSHPAGLVIAREYLEKPAERGEHLNFLHDWLEEHGHAGLQRYLNLSGEGHSPRASVVKDIADRLSGSRGILEWWHERDYPVRRPSDEVRCAIAGHGIYHVRHNGIVTYAPVNHGSDREDRPWRKNRVIGGGGYGEEELNNIALNHHQGVMDRIENPPKDSR